jgi:hypothetical protein
MKFPAPGRGSVTGIRKNRSGLDRQYHFVAASNAFTAGYFVDSMGKGITHFKPVYKILSQQHPGVLLYKSIYI